MGLDWLGPSFGAGPDSKTSEGTKLGSKVGSKDGSKAGSSACVTGSPCFGVLV